MPQTMLIRVVLPAPFGPRSAKIALADLEAYVLQRLQPGGVGLGEMRDRDDRLHPRILAAAFAGRSKLTTAAAIPSTRTAETAAPSSSARATVEGSSAAP